MLLSTSGIQIADRLSIDHINASISNLEQATALTPNGREAIINLDDEKFAQSLMAVALKVKTRKYWIIISLV